MKQNVSEQIVNELIAQIEENNILPWECDWVAHGIPYNFITQKNYRGFNILVLWAISQKMGYADKGFCSYLQAKEHGGNVKKGEHGAPIIYFNFREVERENKEGKTETARVPYTKRYTVFNRSQVENLNIEENQQINPTFRNAEEIINALNITTEYGNPAYSPARDVVYIPKINEFQSSNGYYQALFHEIVHWSGAAHRLNRVKGEKFGDEKYSFEELIAEIGAVFLCAECGLSIETRNNAAYVKSWLNVLKADTSMLVRAASKAQEAVDYIMQLATGNANRINAEAGAEQPATA